eukprot:CAMPEP_0182430926 /NCGR_PEP_ID=MMETSP1167-20130531/44820_1 /TAXON_ID=2988 /ORGANISM="Mallomonas Sp, Strain CCMP3275" /LENGTH=298 /DNA_ID=CAMNT_0024616621 /DNA_START=327 /DNA_END=1220 /DNA_ORIENTATION=-
MLSGNYLSELPIELSNCKELELVRLAANQLVSLPDWFLQLPRLTWLAISGNPLQELSEKHLSLSQSQIPWSDLKLGKTLGEGASGVVSQATWHQPPAAHQEEGEKGEDVSRDIEVAVKVFKGSVTSDGVPADEMRIAASVGIHPNIQRVLGRVQDAPSSALVFSLIDKSYKSLGGPPSFDTITRDVFPSGKIFSLSFIMNVLCGIAAATTHLSQLHVMHADLYAHNILVDSQGSALLGDFGAACSYSPENENAKLFQYLEVRAFGCLIEDLLQCVDNNALRGSSGEIEHYYGTLNALW